jgi:hypothetical protein
LTSLPSTNAAMTVRKNGAEAGTLNTRMGFLIRGQAASWHGRIWGAISNSACASDPLTVITRESG